MSNKNCHICGGHLQILGKLGLLKHFQCRDCGMSFSKKPKVIGDAYGHIISGKY
jgi:tRNA(Ile2) C34 agmatinyltransferase TiaS